MRDNRFLKRGFTLVEAIVSIGILVILTSFFVVYSRSSEQQIVIFKERALMASGISRAKSFAIETFQPELITSPGVGVALPQNEQICGWGIHFDTFNELYGIFHDTVPLPGGDCTTSNKFYTAGEMFETFELDDRVVLGDVCVNSIASGSCLPSSNNIVDVLFIPPEPVVVFVDNGGIQSSAVEAVINLELASDASQNTTIVIGLLGSVEIQ